MGKAAALPLVAFLALVPAGALAQGPRPRSLDYLMLATVDDVRATWVNPAGLARVLEASVMAELVVDRALDGTLRLGQYTLGMNSRGLSLSYLRDRVPDTVSVSVWRLGFSMPFPRGSLGLAISQYRSFGEDEGLDFGARFTPLPKLDLGFVARNISRPFVRGTRLPLSGVLGAAWTAVPEMVQIAVEAEAIERRVLGGQDWRYRGVLHLATRGSRVGMVLAADLDQDGSFGRWTLGVQIGGTDRAGMFGSASPAGGLGRIDRLSAVGVASRRGPGMAR